MGTITNFGVQAAAPFAPARNPDGRPSIAAE